MKLGTLRPLSVYAIAVTPFLPDGAVDMKSVDRMTDFYLACGVSGLTILGIMGEAPKLDPAEALAISSKQVVRRAIVPVIVGVSAPGFAGDAVAGSRGDGWRWASVMIAPLLVDDQISATAGEASGVGMISTVIRIILG